MCARQHNVAEVACCRSQEDADGVRRPLRGVEGVSAHPSVSSIVNKNRNGGVIDVTGILGDNFPPFTALNKMSHALSFGALFFFFGCLIFLPDEVFSSISFNSSPSKSRPVWSDDVIGIAHVSIYIG